MIVIVDHVTLNKDEEDSKGTVINSAEGIEQDIRELLRCAAYEWWSRTASDNITVFFR